MKSFFVLLHEFNLNRTQKYDIMPYLVEVYKECKRQNFWWMFENPFSAPTSKNEYIHFVKRACMNRYWARCEYEWLMIGWPPGKTDTFENCQKVLNSSIKIDAWDQIEMNLEIVTDVFIDNVKSLEI